MRQAATQIHNDAGFTLLEVLVALAVLSVGAVSLLNATQTHATRISEIELRTVARWVANDQLAALRLGLETPQTTTMLDREWVSDIRQSATRDTDLIRADISVQNAGRVMFRLTGFVDTGTRGDGR